MNASYVTFSQLINDTKVSDVLYHHIQKETPILDVTDLLRWQWIQCVSALDKFVHDVVRIGMLEIFNGKRLATTQYDSFKIDISTYQEMNSLDAQKTRVLEQRIMQAHGYQAFQDPKKISEALNHICDEQNKWSVLANHMGIAEKSCKKQLRNIVIRRNQIVHQGDYVDSLSPRQNIFYTDVDEVRSFISSLGKAIYVMCTDSRYYVQANLSSEKEENVKKRTKESI